MKFILFSLVMFNWFNVSGQQIIKGIIADSTTRQALPFATVQLANEKTTVISSINGSFTIAVSITSSVQFSYIGHKPKTILSTDLKNKDTIFLSPLSGAMEEVVIRSQSDKIKRIVNTAIRNKHLHNPEQYKQYECHVYYKMTADIALFGNIDLDSLKRSQDSIYKTRQKKQNKKEEEEDTVKRISRGPSHIMMTETFSKRLYKKPQVQEVILASKFSGLRKTYFANIVTDVLPFHVYADFLNLNSIDYINPIAKGWQQRYRFMLEDEIIIGNDTVFMLSFVPKQNASFNSLTGLVYINSNGYAISHFAGSNNNGDLSNDRQVKFEHFYTFINGRWFPKEMNYDFTIRRLPVGYTQIVWNGHSVIDSVVFDQKPSYAFDKTHPVKFHDSIDLHTEADWQKFRKDTITAKELNTYRFMDSMVQNTPMGKVILMGAIAATGRWPVGKLDLDVKRIVAYNKYEGLRLGLGLYTNNKISKYYSVGGWTGYGFRDKEWKYGTSATIFPKGDKENWISFSYQKDYRIPGQVMLHPELSNTGFRNWLFQQVDVFKEYAATGNIKAGYWDISPSLRKQKINALHYNFDFGGKLLNSFNAYETGIGIRYAYGEKRIPFFEYYLPSGTKYPIAYLKLGTGKITSGVYEAKFIRLLAAITYETHINRWGKDKFRMEVGIVHTLNDQPLPKSFLLAGNGFRRSGNNYYLWGGFITMRPFDFYSDRYASLLYKHDFDKNFWELTWSKPFLSLAHNIIYGGVQQQSKLANTGVNSLNKGYHESGVLINHLLRTDIRVGNLNFNTGVFYHHTNRFDFKKNGVWVVGASMSF